MQKYYLTGFLGSFLPGVVATILYMMMKPTPVNSWLEVSPFQPFGMGLAGGFLAGLIGGAIAKRSSRYDDSGYVMGTGILGFVLAILCNVAFFITNF